MVNDGAKLSRPRILNEASRILREEGVRAFWKGNGVTIVHRLPYSSVNFFAYEQYKMVGRGRDSVIQFSCALLGRENLTPRVIGELCD